MLSHFSHVLLFVTLWTVARHAPLSMEFSRQEGKNTGVGCHFLLQYIYIREVYNSAVTSMDSVQFSPVAQSCPTLCDPMNRSTPGLPVHGLASYKK